ncbi:MAG: hypothetical protein A3I66_11460 [Burkholderiales bacterium RIFCSPLOWO2_02_FULL_57_36]|jgi:hypothetical protein|nr:MAG: hypothetical protein A3I66_11460 [Burkholderiales bacterium RIFCSPLOWO2_02_FULL_57_36]
MPGFLMHVNAAIKCMHTATATIAPSQLRVLVSGQPVATMLSKIGVVGCPFQVPVGAGTKPQPCVIVKWAMPSTRFLVGGKPAALLPAPGPGPAACQSIEQIPQGFPTVSTVQLRVIGT